MYVCSRHRVGLEGEGEGEDAHPRRRFGIRGTRTFVSLARPGVRACVRACVRGSSPHPTAGRRRILSGRSVERDVLETHPNPRLPPGPGNTASELGSGDHSKARSKCRSRWIRIPTRWPVTSRSCSCSGQSCIAIDGSVISACWRSLFRG